MRITPLRMILALFECPLPALKQLRTSFLANVVREVPRLQRKQDLRNELFLDILGIEKLHGLLGQFAFTLLNVIDQTPMYEPPNNDPPSTTSQSNRGKEPASA